MPNISSKKFYHSASGLSFDYPEGWSVEELDGPTLLVLCDEIENGWQAYVEISFEKLTGKANLAAFVQNLLNNYKLAKDNFRLESMTVSPKDKAPNARLVFSHDLKGLSLRTDEMVVQVSEGVLVLSSAVALSSTIQKYAPYFNSVVQSLSV